MIILGLNETKPWTQGWVKIGLLIAVCIYFILFSKFVLNLSTTITIPFSNRVYDIGFWYYIITSLIIMSSTNAVNLTDGLDGLAAGTSAIVLAAFTFIAFLEWTIFDIKYDIDIAVIWGCNCCVCCIFMSGIPSSRNFYGDVGSFSLGGLIAASSILLNRKFF